MIKNGLNLTSLEKEIDVLLRKLFPLCRSLSGPGTQETLKILQHVARFDINKIPSGEKCFDWVVPDEWSVKEAYIADSNGDKIIDFKNNNLHLVGYSSQVDEIMTFEELKPHLHTRPDLPSAIPYRTTYYHKTWGFCLEHENLSKFKPDGKYHVKIDSQFKKGHLEYGEKVVRGKSVKEFLITTYCCHPSIANDNLSGMILWIMLLKILSQKNTLHTYRFVIAPETIGHIAYLAKNKTSMKKVKGGFVVTSVGGPGKFGYKYTFLEDHLIDSVVEKTFKDLNVDYIKYPFDVYGSDERQYSSPSFRIPMGTVTKDKYYEYDSYHTSYDNLAFVNAKNILETLKVYIGIVDNLEDWENNLIYQSTNPFCEPMLSKRGLYPKIGGHQNPASKNNSTAYDFSPQDLKVIRNILFWSDGKTTLVEISKKAKIPVKNLSEWSQKLRKKNLLRLNK